MSTIPTPRTDAASRLTGIHRYDDSFADPDHGWVLASFARQLELELAVEREKHAADVATLRDEFEAFANHFKCSEHTSSDPSDSVAFKKARAIISEHSE